MVPANNPTTVNFLEKFIFDALDAAGLKDLDESTRQELLPRFAAQAEVRLGAALLPLLDKKSEEKFMTMAKNSKTTPEEWQNFWQTTVPNFETVVKDTLGAFANEIKEMNESVK